MSKVDLKKAVALLENGNWEAAHKIVQEDEDSALACWAHGIVHIMEGDLANARYWYRRARREFNADAAGEVAALKSQLPGMIPGSRE